MKLVIVGSMAKAWELSEVPYVKDLIRLIISQEQTDDQVEEFVVGSGESPAGGVDIWVHEIAAEMGVIFMPFPPKARNWPAYKERDQAMADWCTKLIRIKSARSKTYGSGWTRDRAEEQGKDVMEFIPNGSRGLVGHGTLVL